MKKCKTCGIMMPEIMNIDGQCYICILKKGLDKIINRKKYKKAVAIRLILMTPLFADQGMKIVKKVGLRKLLFLDAVIREKIISFSPQNTFYERLINYIDSM